MLIPPGDVDADETIRMRSNGNEHGPVKRLTPRHRGTYPPSVVERKEDVFMKVQFHTSLRLDPTSS
jgi:hypothetical protein